MLKMIRMLKQYEWITRNVENSHKKTKGSTNSLNVDILQLL